MKILTGRRFLLSIVILLIAGMTSLVEAQNVSLQNLGQLKVDQLTDAQIQSFITRMQSTGMSQQQLEQMASARGMPASEISKLRRRIFDLRPDLEEGSVERGRNEFFEARESDVISDQFLFLDSALVDDLQIFGLDLFDNSKLTFEPSLNMPTPKDYIIGPEDEILIDIWGSSEQTYQLEVSPEGFIFIPNLGPIHVSGQTVEDATRRIKNRLTKIYEGLVERGGRTPNTYAQVTLGNLRSIKVHVVGQVQNAATFTLSSLSTLFNALYYAGGPTEDGSLRQIELIRNGVNVATLDTYQYLRGDRSQSIRLQDQDVIIVRPYINRVILDGQVKRKAIYEAKEGETLGDLIAFAGGFKENAYSHFLSVKRNTGREKSVITVNREEFDGFELKGGDEILVESVSNRYVNRVQIRGAVQRPGEFQLTEGMTVKSLIERADGLTGDAFQGRGLVVRTEDDYTLSSLDFNVRDVLNGGNDIPLRNEDVVHIKSIFDLREQYMITIEGEVKNPGEYDFIEGMKVEDLLLIANGLKETAAQSSIEVARRIKSDSLGTDLSITAEVFNFAISKDLSLSEEASNFILKPFDLVIVRKDPAYEEQIMIDVDGEVIYPGKYSLTKKNERISDVIARAGGLTNFAFKNGATLIRRTEFYDEEEQQPLTSAPVSTLTTTPTEDELLTGFFNLGMDLEPSPAPVQQQREIPEDAEDIRRQQLQDLNKRALNNTDFKSHELIGIDLETILKKPGSKHDIILREGDILTVPRQLQTVRLRGELLYPITTRHDPTYSFKDYVSQAGGFSEQARKNKAYVVYANGTAERTKSFLWFKSYPKINPGAQVFIPTKRPKRRLSAGEIAAIATSFVSLAILVDTFVDRTGN